MVGLAEVLSHELAGTGVRVAAVCPGNVLTTQFEEENAWGPAAGASADKALSPEWVADTILAAAAGTAVVVLADKPAMKLSFDALFAMPRSLRLRFRPRRLQAAAQGPPPAPGRAAAPPERRAQSSPRNAAGSLRPGTWSGV